MCARRGGLPGEEGGFRRRVGCCWGGVVDPLLVWDAMTLGPRVVVVWPGGSFCPVGGVGGRDVSVRRKASRAASPPRMVRMCVGPCGEGANCTLHLVSGGRRSECLGLHWCRGSLYEGSGDYFLKAGDRSDDEALCLLDLRLLEGAVFWVPLD